MQHSPGEPRIAGRKRLVARHQRGIARTPQRLQERLQPLKFANVGRRHVWREQRGLEAYQFLLRHQRRRAPPETRRWYVPLEFLALENPRALFGSCPRPLLALWPESPRPQGL